MQVIPRQALNNQAKTRQGPGKDQAKTKAKTKAKAKDSCKKGREKGLFQDEFEEEFKDWAANSLLSVHQRTECIYITKRL